MESMTQIRVRYVETDAMGIVHHASYVAWLELGERNCCASWPSYRDGNAPESTSPWEST